MDQYASPKQGLIMGYRLLLAWNAFTLIFLFMATCFSYREYKIKYASGDIKDADSIHMEESFDKESVD